MEKPYSVDLLKRLVAAIEGGVAKRFGVTISTAIGWVLRIKRQRRSGPDGKQDAAL